MSWLTIVGLIFQFGPQIFEAIASLIAAIRHKNTAEGSAAVSKGMSLATQIVVSLKTRNDMTNEQKREQAWQDLIAGGRSVGITLSESEARTLSELALQKVKGG